MLAAAWCSRLQRDGYDLETLAQRYRQFMAAGPRRLGRFGAHLLRLPPWHLVVAVVTRL